MDHRTRHRQVGLDTIEVHGMASRYVLSQSRNTARPLRFRDVIMRVYEQYGVLMFVKMSMKVLYECATHGVWEQKEEVCF